MHSPAAINCFTPFMRHESRTVKSDQEKAHHVAYLCPQDRLHDSKGRPTEVNSEDGAGFFA